VNRKKNLRKKIYPKKASLLVSESEHKLQSIDRSFRGKVCQQWQQ
jgi:hypothetical protein